MAAMKAGNAETFFNNEQKMDLENSVIYQKVRDKAGKKEPTCLVKVKDPCSGWLIATIRDPKIDINPYLDEKKLINLQQMIKENKQPAFSQNATPMVFDNRPLDWHVMLEHINVRSGKTKKDFWELIERLKHVRYTFNQLLLARYRALPKPLKRNFEIQQLFNETALDLTSTSFLNTTNNEEEEKKEGEQKGKGKDKKKPVV